MRRLVRVRRNDFRIQPSLVTSVNKPLYILVAVHHFDFLFALLKSNICIQLNSRFTYLSFLCRNNNNTVSTSRAINSSRRSILQHLYALNIGRIQQTKCTSFHRIAVNNIKWIVRLRDRTCATHLYRQSLTTWSSVRLLDQYTGNLSCHCLSKVHSRPVFQIFRRN